MNRRKFIGMAGAALAVAGAAGYLASDRRAIVRTGEQETALGNLPFRPGERQILYLASLAPSGHNTQPWFVRYLAPYHWIIGNDRNRWLPAVDPWQRETLLSIGAFVQNLEYAAASLGFGTEYRLLADSSQSEEIIEVKLRPGGPMAKIDPQWIRSRRTVRSGYQSLTIQQADLDFITGSDNDNFHFISNRSQEYEWLNEQTIEANRQQVQRNDAQSELADWIRFSQQDALAHGDGLTTASMEVGGISGWYLRNFYTKRSVMSAKFRDQSIDKVRQQVSQSGGWLLLNSADTTTAGLLECGKRLQRMWLRIRERNIAVHPMTQILEEAPQRDTLASTLGIRQPVQFVLRTGYLAHYPDPVSLRRPVEGFVRFGGEPICY